MLRQARQTPQGKVPAGVSGDVLPLQLAAMAKAVAADCFPVPAMPLKMIA
jgi:hypothetical protein